jgi:hypothetical protein
MIREGYPLADLTPRENNRIWVTLTQKRRWSQLQQLTGMTDADLRMRIKEISRQHFTLTGRK